MFCGSCMKMGEHVTLNFGNKRREAVASWQHTISHFFVYHRIFHQKQHDCCPPPHQPCLPGGPDLAPLWLFSVLSNEDQVERQPIWHSWDDANKKHKQDMLPGHTWKTGRIAGTGMHTWKGTLLWEWWYLIGIRWVFDQMAVLVLNTFDNSAC